MSSELEKLPVRIFSTCPQSSAVERHHYLDRVATVSRWSEAAGCTGMLVYTDNSLVDPWLVAQVILQSTITLCPLMAIQPVYMHPYTVAKMISTLGYLHGRRLFLNMVAGGFKNDLEALNDSTPHDRRYDRLVEYTNVIKLLLKCEHGVTFDGEFYKTRQLKLTPPLPPELFPGLLISGSSDAGIAAAKAIGATAVKYPEPVETYERVSPDPGLAVGMRVGIIARRTDDEAWTAGHDRFPGDRRGQLAHQLAMKISDSIWHRKLSDVADRTAGSPTPYWLHPFQNYKTFCPYLVGSYDVVAAEVARYVATGHRTFILDIPQTEDELGHIGEVFKRATMFVEA
jgi:alkanesulfonate monooxygenase